MHFTSGLKPRRFTFAALAATAAAAGAIALAANAGASSKDGSQTPLPATLDDYFEPGTQENTLIDAPVSAWTCYYCHQFKEDGNRKEVVAPSDNWVMSMMAQAARDPVWHAALAVANQDAAFSGDTCIRCHSPGGWLSGRSVPTDGSALKGDDFDGVSCNFCHRMVDPYPSPSNPKEDGPILAALQKQGLLPTSLGNGRYVVDPIDVRRGPLDDVPENFHGVPIIVSDFHREGQMCGACHDVSNSLFTRQADGTYALNKFGSPHPTLDPHEMMPEQRTYSEWLNSEFASTGVYFPDNRFGGDHPTGIMRTCQDCHMPKHYGGACTFWEFPPFFPRPDVAEHAFVGANTWVLGAVYDLYGKAPTGLSAEAVDLTIERTKTMLRNASDMQVMQFGDHLRTRIINQTGHKLPTGYPEGRRMWINVKFFDSNQNLIAERGHYDYDAATLHGNDTKVYEMKLGIGEDVAATAGVPAGESHHLVLNNEVLKDNRIPPRGFTNAAFEAIRAPVVGHSYADGQYWDDTAFEIPNGAAQAVVTLMYQTTSREYIEFLRDANTTNDAGEIAYNAWLARGKSAPVDMDVQTIPLGPPKTGDLNQDGSVNVLDLLLVINGWGYCPPPTMCGSDLTGDNVTNVLDLLAIINNWG